MDKNELMALDPELAALMQSSEVKPEEQRSNFEDEDRKVPRIGVMQALSELVSSGDCQPGQIAMNLSGHVYADKGEAFTFVPIFYWKSRVRFIGVGADAEVACQANDGKVGVGDPGGDCYSCKLAEWTEDGDQRIKPECQATHNLFVCVPEAEEPNRFGIISFSKTSYQAGTKLLNRIMAQQGQLYAFAYSLGSKRETSGKNSWWVWEPRQWDDGHFERGINHITNDFASLFKECESVYLKFKDTFTRPSTEMQALADPTKEDVTESPF